MSGGSLRTRVGFIGATGALVVLYFASGSPIPLYTLFQEQMGLTHSQLSMASMWYLLGTVIPLMFMSRISDHIGRRPATIIILCVSISGCLTFAYISSPEMLMAGRLIQGIASGLGSSTIAAYVVDLSAGLPKWVGPMITSSAPTLGLSTGAFVSGGIASYTEITYTGYFEVVIAVICVIMVMILLARETMERKPGLACSFIPRFALPAGALRLYLASTMVFVGTWAVGGFSQSFSSTIALEMAGTDNAFIAAGVFTSLLLPNVVGSFFAKRFETRQAQRWGMASYTACIAMMYVSLSLGLLWGFIAFSVLAGVSQGIAFTSSVTDIISRASKPQRASTFSLIYLTSYGGAAIPNLVVGMIPGEYGVLTIMSWYVALVVVMFAALMLLSARPYPRSEAAEVSMDGGQ